MTDSNSGNNTRGGTITITGSGGGGGGGSGNGQWITAVPNKQYTVTIPSGGTCSTGGTIIIQTGTGANPQISIDDIEWAVPVEISKKSDGCSCKKCREFFEYAEPNQEDGTLICWACRHGY